MHGPAPTALVWGDDAWWDALARGKAATSTERMAQKTRAFQRVLRHTQTQSPEM